MPMQTLVLAALAVGFLTLVATIVGLTFALTRARDAARVDAQRLFEQMDLALGELRDLGETVAANVAAVRELRSRADEQRRTPATPPPASARSYDIALRLARNGATREELMSSCGMSRHEAELAVRLHGPARGAGAARAADPARVTETSRKAETPRLAAVR